jgi:hypothetical protein
MRDGYARKIEGRSSFARLGLTVHCTGDFINPVWDGFMPLRLTNHGTLPIRIAPFFPICQLMIVPLASPPERTYGDEELRSKYVNDDGGPSRWWRDGRIRELQERLAGIPVEEAVQREIAKLLRFEGPTILWRLTRFLGRRKGIEHASETLDRFAFWANVRRFFDLALIGLPGGAVRRNARRVSGHGQDHRGHAPVVAHRVDRERATRVDQLRTPGRRLPRAARAARAGTLAGRGCIMSQRTVRAAEASETPQTVPMPGLYRHFKGGEYELLSVARHSEAGQLLVVYRAVSAPDETWVRPLEMFTETVPRPGGCAPRFEPMPHDGASVLRQAVDPLLRVTTAARRLLPLM